MDLGDGVDLVSARGSRPRLGWQLAANHDDLPYLAVASPVWDNVLRDGASTFNYRRATRLTAACGD
jgi:hypothetical protein